MTRSFVLKAAAVVPLAALADLFFFDGEAGATVGAFAVA